MLDKFLVATGIKPVLDNIEKFCLKFDCIRVPGGMGFTDFDQDKNLENRLLARYVNISLIS